jgi:hypothetical protein
MAISGVWLLKFKTEILEWCLDHQPQCPNELNVKIQKKQHTLLRGGGNYIADRIDFGSTCGLILIK